MLSKRSGSELVPNGQPPLFLFGSAISMPPSVSPYVYAIPPSLCHPPISLQFHYNYVSLRFISQPYRCHPPHSWRPPICLQVPPRERGTQISYVTPLWASSTEAVKTCASPRDPSRGTPTLWNQKTMPARVRGLAQQRSNIRHWLHDGDAESMSAGVSTKSTSPRTTSRLCFTSSTLPHLLHHGPPPPPRPLCPPYAFLAVSPHSDAPSPGSSATPGTMLSPGEI